MPRVLVTGAGNQVGFFLVPRLLNAGYQVVVATRHRRWAVEHPSLDWHCVNLEQGFAVDDRIDAIVHLAPLSLINNIAQQGARIVIAFSSTSVTAKRRSKNARERGTAESLQHGERMLSLWADRQRAASIVIRPTLIYGCGLDANITRLARWIGRWPIFPLCGRATGRRQPVHADDLAQAVVRLIELDNAPGLLILPGGETLAYRDMLKRIAAVMGKRRHLVSVPAAFCRIGLAAAHAAGRLKDVNLAMLERMNEDLVFPLDDWMATGVSPRGFQFDALEITRRGMHSGRRGG